ncbi:hypothetical protein D7Y15_30670 [Corallococcus sp. AB030]|nr:hypothetical protein D7Y15_30670 [Corallococcus sp. AB030]
MASWRLLSGASSSAVSAKSSRLDGCCCAVTRAQRRRTLDMDANTSKETGGLAALKGYDYQEVATVWLALHLIFERQVPYVVIEPAPHADLEAVPVEDASSNIRFDSARILFQIKYRGSAWTGKAAFRKIVEAPPPSDTAPARKRSPVPVEQLAADPSLRYVLITNGQFASDSRDFVVPRLESLPRKVPKAILDVPEGASTEEIASRIGIMELLTHGELATRIRRLFESPDVALFVPATRFDEALMLLKQDVHAKLIGDGPLQWTRDDILERLRRLGGSPTRTADMDDFVPPQGYDQFEERLAKGNGLLLKGPPGAGKTLVGDMLAFKLRMASPPFEVVYADSPGEILQRLGQGGPFLFRVDDPWGQDARTPEKGWATQLPTLFRRVSGTAHKILVATRMGLLGDVYGGRVPPEVERASATLDYESYDTAARQRILARKSRALQSVGRRQFVRKHREEILETLKVPLSIDRFVSAVIAAPRHPELDLEKLLHDAEVGELSGTLEREVRGLGWAQGPAMFLWTQLCVSAACDFGNVRMRAQRLQRQPQKPFPIQRLVDWLVEAGWLRRNDMRLSAHPTTVTGLGRFLDSLPDEADHLMGELLEQLCGKEEVHAAYEIADRLPDARRASLPDEVSTRIQQHLIDEVLRTPFGNFVEVLHATRRWAPEGGPIALLLDALLHPPRPADAGWWELRWVPPDWQPSTYELIQASSDTRRILERYIHFWPWTVGLALHESGFEEWTSRFGWDLSQVYSQSLHDSLEAGGHAVGELVQGALSGPAPDYEALLDRILMALEKPPEGDAPGELYRKANQGVLDAAYADYLLIGDGTAHEAAYTALDGWVVARRRREGHAWILTHPRRSRLYGRWADAMREGNPPPGVAEVEAFLDVGEEVSSDDAWRIIAEHQFAIFAPRMVDALGTVPQKGIGSCLGALSGLIPAPELGAALRERSLGWSEERRAFVVMAAEELASWSNDKMKPYREELSAAMGVPLATLVKQCVRTASDKKGLHAVPRLSSEDCARLRQWAQRPEGKLGQASLLTLAVSGESVVTEAAQALASGDPRVRIKAVRALAKDSSSDARGLLLRTLSDVEARVREAVVRAFPSSASPEEQQALLRHAHDESSFVRKAFVGVMAREHWDLGRNALVELLRDSHDNGPGVEEHVEHGIARAAAKALAEWKPHPPAVIDELLRFVADGLDANTDPEVHKTVLATLMKLDDPRVAATISSAIHGVTGLTRSSATRLCLLLVQALSIHLPRYPQNREVVAIVPLAREAMGAESYSTGCAILVLGMVGAHAETARILESCEPRWERAVLALLGAALTAAAPSDAAEQVLRQHEGIEHFLAWSRSGEQAAAEVWARRWSAHASLHAWFAELWEVGGGWANAILWGGQLRHGQAFVASIEAHPRLRAEPES